MSMGPRKMIAALAAAVVVGVGWVAWHVWDDTGLLIALLAVVAAGLAVVGWLVATAERELRNLVQRRWPEELSRQIQATAERIDRHAEGSEEVLAVVEAKVSRLETILRDELIRLHGEVDRLHDEVRSRHDELDERATRADDFRQVEALLALYRDVDPVVGFPRTRPWAASPDLLLYLFGTVGSRRGSLVVECGSGLSTVVFAYALRSVGTGRVIALEHDAEYAERTRDLLDRHGVSEWAEVRFAPLQPVMLEGEEWPWYSGDALPDGLIDLLFVDGPPGSVREQSRFPALPMLRDRLAAGGIVVMDDYRRSDERAVVERWMAAYPDLDLETIDHEKGTAILRRRETG